MNNPSVALVLLSCVSFSASCSPNLNSSLLELTDKKDPNQPADTSPPDFNANFDVEVPGNPIFGGKKVAAILFNFTDNNTEEGTPDQLRQNLYTGASSANSWFKEVSYDNFWITGANEVDGDIFGYVKIPFPEAPCEYEKWVQSANAQASLQGFDIDDYDYVLYFHTSSICGSRGMPHLDPPSAIMGSFSLKAIVHEFGHALGWNHSSSLYCTQVVGNIGFFVPFSEFCGPEEYGDPYDVMGALNAPTGGLNAHHVSAQKRGYFGWLEKADAALALYDDTFSITPIALEGTMDRVLRVPRLYSSTGLVEQAFYVEMRTDTGFDYFPSGSPGLDGVMIRLANGFHRPGRSFLIDMEPSSPSFADSVLLPGDTFTDPTTGIEITLSDLKPLRATLDVKVGTPKICDRNPPELTIFPNFNGPIKPGDIITYDLVGTNMDTVDCPDTPLQFQAIKLPPGWFVTEGGGPLEGMTAPGDTITTTIAIESSAATVPNNYSLTLRARNTDAGFTKSIQHSVSVQ